MSKENPIKRANASIVSFVQKTSKERSLPSKINVEDAWCIISENLGLIGSVISNRAKTKFEMIWGEDEVPVKVLEWPTEEVYLSGDWDWSRIYIGVLEFLMKNKLYSINKIKKYLKSVEKPIVNRTKTVLKSIETPKVIKSIDQDENSLKSKKKQLYFKIYNLKKVIKKFEEKLKSGDESIILKHKKKLEELSKAQKEYDSIKA